MARNSTATFATFWTDRSLKSKAHKLNKQQNLQKLFVLSMRTKIFLALLPFIAPT